VTQATLRLFANSSSSAGFDLHQATSTNWGETGIKFKNAPTFSSGIVSSSGPVTTGTWTTVDVTGVITGNGNFTIVLTSTASTALSFGSRESANAPQLVVTTADLTPPTVTLTKPANGSTVGSATPSFAGVAGSASGDSAAVTVKVYSGSGASGTPLETLSASRQADNSYSVAAAPALAAGTYTAQAQQSDAAGNTGFSSANTFTVDTSPPPPPCGFEASPPVVYSHVIWIVMENRSYGEIVGNPAAPYLNSLVSRCGLATNFFAEAHPSLPNYLAMTSGSTQGVTDNGLPSAHPLSVDSIFSQAASWKSYEESMPSNCYGQDLYPYSAHHNPAAYYTNLACGTGDIPMGTTSSGALVDDLANDTLPAFAFVTPNQCDNMHDDCGGGAIATGDGFLAVLVPKILASPAYQAGTLALFVTWDEDDDTSGNQVATLVASPSTAPGTRSATLFNHYSMLRTTEELLGVSYLGNAATATSMRAAFGL
jgi:hypothetical protein